MRSHVLTATVFALPLSCWMLACTDDGGAETTQGSETATTDLTTEGDGDGDPTGAETETDTGAETDTGETGDGDGDPNNNPNCDDPWMMLCEYAGGEGNQLDCGLVTEADDDAAWQAAHDCAIEAVGMQVGFKVMGQAHGIDSLLSWAYGALEGETYQPLTFLYDDWGPTANYSECADIDKEPGCKIEVGDLCLRCVDASEPQLICN